jgi:hypothetical protein
VARLHAVDPGYFAEELASERREKTWAGLVEARLAELDERHSTCRTRWSRRDAFAACSTSSTRARPTRSATSLKLRMWVFEAVPDAEDAFLAGYGTSRRRFRDYLR